MATCPRYPLNLERTCTEFLKKWRIKKCSSDLAQCLETTFFRGRADHHVNHYNLPDRKAALIREDEINCLYRVDSTCDNQFDFHTWNSSSGCAPAFRCLGLKRSVRGREGLFKKRSRYGRKADLLIRLWPKRQPGYGRTDRDRLRRGGAAAGGIEESAEEH